MTIPKSALRLMHAFCLLVLASPASAHGEDVLLFVAGQLASLIGLIYLSIWKHFRSVAATAIFLVLLVSSWIVPGEMLPIWIRHTAWGNLLFGLLPCLVLGLWYWRTPAESKSDESSRSD
jgi:Na+/pantothenate symporter